MSKGLKLRCMHSFIVDFKLLKTSRSCYSGRMGGRRDKEAGGLARGIGGGRRARKCRGEFSNPSSCN